MSKATKAIAAVFTAAALIAVSMPCASAEEPETKSSIAFKTSSALYAHAVSGDDTQAWAAWQCAHNDELIDVDVNTKYFFLPSSVGSSVDIYNAASSDVTICGTSIAPNESKPVSYEVGKTYSVNFEGKDIYVIFVRSTAEAAIYVNNSDADEKGTDLMSYLCAEKSNTATAEGAIVSSDGKIDNTPIKKIKGRGNTTWQKSKKPFNITYNDKVQIAGMAKSKKYSLLANYQDDSLSRNRFLYDLSDAVGIPYASDSRYVDFYVNGYYWGSYQLTEKIEVGSSSLVNDFKESDYLNEDNTVKTDFPFLCEIDPSANSDDYTVKCSGGVNVTIKAPDLSPSDVGYNEVKVYVKTKFDEFLYACANPTKRELSDYGDIDSLTKLYLINELGKNWDSGAASTFFTYKQDKDGKFKFYGSPVWDYDNSLGNAVGVKDDLKSMGVTDYEKYTGWWCMYKGKKKSSSTTSNVINNLSRHPVITEAAPKIWFEKFVPAMLHFSGEAPNEAIASEFYPREKYFDIVKGSAEMNYKSGWLLNTGSWIANHTSIDKAHFDYKTGEYSAYPTRRLYPETFEGMYNYCGDWFESRAAWLSSQMYEDYKNSQKGILGDANGDGSVNSSDALAILRSSLGLEDIPEERRALADANSDGVIDSNDALIILRFTVGLDDGKTGIGEAI